MALAGALIGCGYIAHQQLTAWKNVRGAQIMALCDLDEARARTLGTDFQISHVYTDFRSLLVEERLDFVDIATRPASHAELTATAAARGLHVLCQKPMAPTLAEAESMVRACRQAGVTLMINENGRHQTWFRRLKTLLDSDALGQVHSARFETRWRATLPEPDFEGQGYFADMPRLIVYEFGVHYLDIARFLFGEASSLYARLQRVSPHIRGEDSALIVAGFGPVTCTIDLNWYALPEPGRSDVAWGSVLVEGTRGTARLHTDGRLELFAEDGEQAWEFPTNAMDLSFTATQQHFIDRLLAGLAPETSGEETLKTMALVEAAYASAAEERVIKLATPPRT
jgi:D-apiose dehydrogenase